MLLINQVKCTLDEPCTKETVASKLNCKAKEIHSLRLVKESIDARKDEIQFVYTVLVEIENESRFLKFKDVSLGEVPTYPVKELNVPLNHRPIVVGFGPSGIFTALTLAEAGCKPIIIERGKDVDQRIIDVETFWKDGILNTESNVQYGEGGAGTFSDGKLTTRIKDKRVIKVINTLLDAGASEEIRYQAHPHIGTDKLRDIVKNIRKKIIALGGEIHFDTKLEELCISDNKVTGLIANGKEYKSDTVFLCLGHSARDTIATLYTQHVYLEPKDFAIGVRIEHPQDFINQSQYGVFKDHPRLHAAEYRLTHTATNGRGVYTFCMCPGGDVISSPSLSDTIVVNGMSESGRNKENANSAVLVQIPTSDFYHDSPLDGFKYQDELEKAAFNLGGGNYKAPIQLIEDYLNHQPSTSIKSVTPTYSLGVTPSDLHSLFNEETNKALEEGLQAFNRKIKGYAEVGAVMTGIETRSSCPIRIKRDESLQSIDIKGLYPCGEGAGYAGGIVSSAVDGIRCSESFIDAHNEIQSDSPETV